ncbi:psbP domain-containing protein 3, chloroplastic-like isoform X1 [Miscanthus floridulus]|uniref:psbP domain-containing protein 3, chloroplastic-like isoform X1 n=1 Tax=Miscanthus floridulus TaxID=154761 RepID=UPI0034595380
MVVRVEGLDRRDALLGIALSAAAPPLLAPAVALADEATTESQEGFTTYEDEANKFSIQVPQGWLVGAGEASGIKSVTAFYPEQAAADSNVSVAITGIGPDFTSLKSFGDVDSFAEGLVNGLDRSWQKPPGLAAKLIDSRAANGLYYLEYTLQNPGERRRHIVSAIGMAFNGWYNRLYTVTGQYIDDDDSEKYRPQIEKVRRSVLILLCSAPCSFMMMVYGFPSSPALYFCRLSDRSGSHERDELIQQPTVHMQRSSGFSNIYASKLTPGHFDETRRDIYSNS